MVGVNGHPRFGRTNEVQRHLQRLWQYYGQRWAAQQQSLTLGMGGRGNQSRL